MEYQQWNLNRYINISVKNNFWKHRLQNVGHLVSFSRRYEETIIKFESKYTFHEKPIWKYFFGKWQTLNQASFRKSVLLRYEYTWVLSCDMYHNWVHDIAPISNILKVLSCHHSVGFTYLAQNVREGTGVT